MGINLLRWFLIQLGTSVVNRSVDRTHVKLHQVLSHNIQKNRAHTSEVLNFITNKLIKQLSFKDIEIF